MAEINFRKPTVEDVDKIREFLKDSGVNCCDYTPANIFLWSMVYHTQVSITDEALFVRYMHDGEYYFLFPIVKKHLKNALEMLISFCEETQIEFKLGVVEPWMFELIDTLYPKQFEVTYHRNGADYVYKTEHLAKLAGKKYHGKKNHINKFKKLNEDWSYERICKENVNDCIVMVKEWCVENECCNDQSKADEICVMINGLCHMDELSLKGGLIRAGERIVAVTIGEEVNENMFVIHFEKAFASVQGAYPMINQQFILNELMEYQYVNREEDMGLEGLRKAKESYHPEFLVEKGVVKRKK
ncbi:MAG: DUF2156 domain-containing protein [Lachnospiraceae bacterium]|nr:DUF2156 domain-containing protein [Lachnospiraceae bacterium]